MASLEVPGGATQVQREIPVLNEFPVVSAASHSSDSNYPSLQWQPRAAKIAIFRIIAATNWLKVTFFHAMSQFVKFGQKSNIAFNTLRLQTLVYILSGEVAMLATVKGLLGTWLGMNAS